jgi:hypothetical protein
MPQYPRYVTMTIEDALWFDLFDDIQYIYVKDAIKEDEPIDVEILVTDSNERCACNNQIMIVRFVFELAGLPFIHKTRLIWTSPAGQKLNRILCGDDSDEEEVSDEEEEVEEPTSVMHLNQYA